MAAIVLVEIQEPRKIQMNTILWTCSRKNLDGNTVRFRVLR